MNYPKLPIIKYEYSGLFKTEEVWIHPERSEVTYEIIYVTEGVVHLLENGVEYSLEKGDAILLPAGIIHKGSKESYGKTEFYWIHFHVKEYDKLDIHKNILKGFNNISLFRQLLHVANTNDYPNYSVNVLLLALLSEMSHFSQHNENPVSGLVYEAAEWIRINVYEKMTVEKISGHYGYSSDHFSRLFKKHYKLGLKEYIYTEKMKAARNLLCNYGYSVKQVSAMLAFDNEEQFIHFFKYHQNESPTKFRNVYYNLHMNKN